MTAMINPTAAFKGNLQQLPAVDAVARIELLNGSGETVDTIDNKPGKQGSLAVYHYLNAVFGALDAPAAVHGLAVFAEHTSDARARPGAHPNIDRLLTIADGGERLTMRVVEKD